MKSLIAVLAEILMISGLCQSCSWTEEPDWKSAAELTCLAPLVLHAKVVATEKKEGSEYNATLKVNHVYKGDLNATQIVADRFSNSAACQSHVSVGDEKIFFLDVNPFRARYDDPYSAVTKNTSETFEGIMEGLCCCPNTTDCPRQNYTCRGCMMTATSTWLFIILLGTAVKLLLG